VNPRRRGAVLEDAILQAAWEVLADHGYPGFTYEAVAARAGTSRPVLYRRWPKREDLLLAAITRFWRSRPIEVPDTGNLRDDALGYLRNAAAGRSHWIASISAQLMEYFRDSGSTFSELRDIVRVPGRQTGFEVIAARAVARGELADVPRPARVLNLPFDLLRHDIIMTMGASTDESLVEIIDDVWLPLLGA
jgi:AcrR family transcriptional regulator